MRKRRRTSGGLSDPTVQKSTVLCRTHARSKESHVVLFCEFRETRDVDVRQYGLRKESRFDEGLLRGQGVSSLQ
jgi:hypothetical protein